MKPYYSEQGIDLYLGDCREVLPELGTTFDLVIADPPYGDTSIKWDIWPDGWPAVVAQYARSMWCFGSARMFLDHGVELTDSWTYSQDIVWKKHNGSGFHNDRFRRVHEFAYLFYQGQWGDIYKAPEYTNDAVAKTVRRKERPAHTGEIANSTYTSQDGGPRLATSVIEVRSMHGKAIHPTEKPLGIIEPLIRYGCKPGGTVLDPFAGSGSSLVAAMANGRRSVGIEEDEKYCEAIARRLEQGMLDFEEPA